MCGAGTLGRVTADETREHPNPAMQHFGSGKDQRTRRPHHTTHIPPMHLRALDLAPHCDAGGHVFDAHRGLHLQCQQEKGGRSRSGYAAGVWGGVGVGCGGEIAKGAAPLPTAGQHQGAALLSCSTLPTARCPPAARPRVAPCSRPPPRPPHPLPPTARTACTLFTFCPPAPPLRIVVTSRSASGSSTESTSSPGCRRVGGRMGRRG